MCHLEFPQLKFYIIWRDFIKFGVAESGRKPVVTMHFPEDLKFTKYSPYVLIYFSIFPVLESRITWLLVHIKMFLVAHVLLSDNPKPTQEKASMDE